MIKNNPLLLGPFLLAERFQSPHLISAPAPSPSTTEEGAESQSLDEAEQGIQVTVVGGLTPPPFEEEAVVFNEAKED